MHPVVRALFALWVSLGSASAQAFQIEPVRIDLPAERANAVLTVRNPGPDTLLIQAEGFRWQQQHGEDTLTPAPQLIVNPPIFEIPPGGQQLVRVGLRATLTPASETSYRLWLTQLATPQARDTPADGGVRLLFRASLPVFVTPRQAAPAQAVWLRENGQLRLVNPGARHMRLNALALQHPDGQRLTLNPGYVLAGAYTEWPLPAAWQHSRLDVEATSDLGPLSARLAAPPQ